MFYSILGDMDDLENYMRLHQERIIITLVVLNYLLFFVYYMTQLTIVGLALVVSLVFMTGFAWSYGYKLNASFLKKYNEEVADTSEEEAEEDTDSNRGQAYQRVSTVPDSS